MDNTDRIKKILIVILALLLGFIGFLIINIITNATKTDYHSSTDRIAELYNDVVGQLAEGKTSISIDSASESDVRTVVELVYDQPEYFWLARQYSISSAGSKFMVQFTVYYKEHSTMYSQAKDAADEIIAAAPENANDYEMVKYVHDELCNRIRYVDTNDESEHNIYGALVNGESVCEGYAKAFMFVLNRAGIETKYFSGTSLKDGEAVPHAWNGAYLDGEFYYFDITWDDIESEYISYAEFGLNSVDVMRNHTFDEYHPMIESSATKCNYYVYNDFILSEYSKDNVAKIVKKQGNIVDIKCTSIVAYNKLVLAISNPYQLNEILSAAESENTGFNRFSYMLDDSTYCVRLYFD